MDTRGFKKLIKEAVREAIQEELKDILLEAVRAPKTVIQESYVPTPIVQPTQEPSVDVKSRYKELLEGMMETRNGNLNVNSTNALGFGASQPYRPPATVNTAGEGSALPAGEVSLDQLMGLMNKK